MAREACSIVSAIRFEEQQTVWTSDFEDSLTKDSGAVFPGMMFGLARERMESTKLWKIIKKMPKGALLHCHLEAMVDMDWMLDEIFNVGAMHIKASAPMDSEDACKTVDVKFQWLKTARSSEPSIWTSSYKADELVPLEVAADSYPFGGRQGFKNLIRSKATITHSESLKHQEGPGEIWKKFQSCFGVIGTILHYEPIWRGFIPRFLRMLVQDGVQYVDLRAVAHRLPFYKTGSEEPEKDATLIISILDDEILNFQESEEGKNFWGARLIFTDVRQFGTKMIIEGMKQCIALKEQFPELIAGYDLVGHEDSGRPLSDVTPELFWFKKACAEHGVDIPFFFHAGETLGDGDSTDENLFDAILLGTRRIGHGFSLYKHPLLVNMVKERKILVESCPISNEVLRLTSSIMTHPLPALLAQGVPTCLNNDDPAILGQGHSGMTHDFWQALQGWENLGLEGLGSLAENSIRYASFDDFNAKEWAQDVKEGAFGHGERAQRMKEWAQAWEKFCQWIVLEFGQDLDLDPEE